MDSLYAEVLTRTYSSLVFLSRSSVLDNEGNIYLSFYLPPSTYLPIPPYLVTYVLATSACLYMSVDQCMVDLYCLPL